MTTAGVLLCALVLDALLGEPRWLWSRAPHPAVLMGNLISWCDKRFNSDGLLRLKGSLVMLSLGVFAILLGALISKFGWALEIIIVAILIAQKSLVEHVAAVATALRQSTENGRASVAMIVGRDTADMDDPAIARSAIESAAENLSDGVIAPAFWFLIGGLPLLLLYKITNTADSMIGYRTPRHEAFGWAAARFDDLLNLIPARLTALLIALPYGLLSKLPEIRKEALKHRSPNAGWPEAAMARALGVAVSGPRSYEGALRDFPFVNETGRKSLSANDIEAACRALWVTWGVFAALVFALWLFSF
ncbi:adenosylcobinamide-phosphate synthase [Planktotalea frisia]|jgi:adenosylcobinamide-phosphate synthase|uniref:Cobalamin biosynthesis protein CobD n=1 Tax=Planktotalea frisia TaxID=696762 RepID=A0A1L9NVR3_9RHOB|nr:adenosylcobinamide-phosphate synthase CbiB [Planktotalea frisia]OJI93390.1 cobalamin biosynthesis protein CbiB [Planktotalea frisia]PZX35107.1 adenosylcobinamide-phosphate synthase [Planktotalea frisia]